MMLIDVLKSEIIPVTLSVILLLGWILIRCNEKKWNLRERVGMYLLDSPIVRTSLFVLTVILSGILCSAFVSELNTVQGAIEWGSFYNKLSFYWLLFIVIVDFIYNWFGNSTESDILKYSNKDWLMSYLRSKTIDTLVEQLNDQIKKGDVKPIDINKLYQMS